MQVVHLYVNSYRTPACKIIWTWIVSQGLLHRSSANFRVIKLYLNHRNILRLHSFYFFLAGGEATRSLCRVSDTKTCGDMRFLLVLGWNLCGKSACQVCGNLVFWRAKDVVEWKFIFGTGKSSTDRASRTSKYVAKWKLWQAGRTPFARNKGCYSNWIIILKIRCKHGKKIK